MAATKVSSALIHGIVSIDISCAFYLVVHRRLQLQAIQVFPFRLVVFDFLGYRVGQMVREKPRSPFGPCGPCGPSTFEVICTSLDINGCIIDNEHKLKLTPGPAPYSTGRFKGQPLDIRL